MSDTTKWVDRDEYPFRPRYFPVEHGRMHFIDEGSGDVILFVHGNPTWSFLFRDIVKTLSSQYRCVAPDHLGFGLSDKPPKADYRPQVLARNLGKFVEALQLRDITLVVHDWGGMIGMAWALANPGRVRRIIVFNSQFWSVNDVRAARLISGFFGCALGRFLALRLNGFPRFVMPLAMGRRKPLTRSIHAQYMCPFPSPDSRLAPWTLGKSIVGESAWLESLWRQRSSLADKPLLILWGGRDRAFGADKLARWEGCFTDHETHVFPDVGHFVPEELGVEAAEIMRAWFDRVSDCDQNILQEIDMPESSEPRAITVEYEFDAPPETVWMALTEPKKLEQWLMPNDIAPDVGHRFTFSTDPAPGFDGIVRCEIREALRPKLLTYTWRGGPVDTVVTWALRESPNGGTLLRLVQDGFTPEQDAVYAMLEWGWREKAPDALARVVEEAA